MSNGIDITLQVPNCLCCEVCLDDASSLWLTECVRVYKSGWLTAGWQTDLRWCNYCWLNGFNKVSLRDTKISSFIWYPLHDIYAKISSLRRHSAWSKCSICPQCSAASWVRHHTVVSSSVKLFIGFVEVYAPRTTARPVGLNIVTTDRNLPKIIFFCDFKKETVWKYLSSLWTFTGWGRNVGFYLCSSGRLFSLQFIEVS